MEHEKIHQHQHEHGPDGTEDMGRQKVMLTYLLEHNRHHAQEIEVLADSFPDTNVQFYLRKSVSAYENGNKMLAEALVLLKKG